MVGKMVLLGLLFLYLPGCAASAIVPLAYTATAIAGAAGVASIPMQMQAMSRGGDIQRQAEANMQSQKARDEERLAMERERHQSWQVEQQQVPQPHVLINPDTGAVMNNRPGDKQAGFVEIDKLPSVGIKLPKNNNAENGIIIEGVYPGSPAAKAGLKGGDKIVEKNGQPVKTLSELKSQRGQKIGDMVEYKIIRGGREMVFSMKTVPFADIVEAK